MSKTLILVRHAHRNTDDRTLDNGLSEKGFEQAQRLSEFFLQHFSDPKPHLISSPKKRCRETLASMASGLRKRVFVSSLLDEASPGESTTQFFNRITRFLSACKRSKAQVIVACSHGDWIPACIQVSTGQSLELKKGGLVQLALSKERVQIEKVIQKF